MGLHRKPIPVSEAVERVMKYARKGTQESVSINDCDSRYLADDIIADHDIPHFDRAPYDGFAIDAEDSKGASQDNPVTFEVIEEIGAGSIARNAAGGKKAIRIMTGAKMPEGSNAVVMLELANEFKEDGKTYMSIKRTYKPGDNVSYKGAETTEGDILVKKGRKINPGIKAVLATFGYAKVLVMKKPVVGLFATGSELLDVDEELEPGKIRNSNAYMMSSQIIRAGGEVKYFGQLVDDVDITYQSVKEMLKEVDCLVTTGGVAVGDYDHMPAIYERLGAEVLFNKIAMRPGSVTTVAQLDGKLLFGLSGNPSASYVGFEIYTRPVIQAMLETEKPHLKKVTAELTADFPKANPFTRFVRSTIGFSDGKAVVEPSGMDKSNVVTSLINTNSLMILPGGTRGFASGDMVEVLLLEDFEGSEWPWA